MRILRETEGTKQGRAQENTGVMALNTQTKVKQFSYTPESKAMTLAKTYGAKNITFILGPTFSEALMCLQLSFKVRKKMPKIVIDSLCWAVQKSHKKVRCLTALTATEGSKFLFHYEPQCSLTK